MTEDQTTALTHPWRGVTLSALATAGLAGLLLMTGYFVGFALESYLPPSEEIGLMILFGIIYAFLSAPVMWVSLVAIGLPIHLALKKYGLTGFWHYVAIGQIAGILCAGLLYYANPLVPDGGLMLVAIFMFAGMGGIAAAFAWHFSKAESA